MRTPDRSLSAPRRAASTRAGTGCAIDVESSGSCPPITSCSRAASSTVRVTGPAWSRELARATRPYRETPPYVGFTPTVPVTAPGWRIEPPVSEPIDSGASYAARAAALPPPEPPGIRSRSHGLRVGPYAEYSVEEPMANSSMLVLPSITVPAARSRSTIVASYGGGPPPRAFEGGGGG